MSKPDAARITIPADLFPAFAGKTFDELPHEDCVGLGEHLLKLFIYAYDELLTAPEVAKMFGPKTSVSTIYGYEKAGLIPPAIRFGKKSTKWRRYDIAAAIEKRNGYPAGKSINTVHRERKAAAEAALAEEADALGMSVDELRDVLAEKTQAQKATRAADIARRQEIARRASNSASRVAASKQPGFA